MKIKGVIKNLNFKKIVKHDNNKNILMNFSGAVMGSVGSVQFQIVPCSSFYVRVLKVCRPPPMLSQC